MWRPIARLVGLTLLLDAAVAAVLSAASLKEYDALLAERPTAVVAVYAPWCGHSRALLPEYDAAAALLGRRVPLIKVDGTVAEDVATRLDVKGYPTLFFVRDGVADEFEGERTAKQIESWAKAMLEPELQRFDTAAAAVEWGRSTAASAAASAAAAAAGAAAVLFQPTVEASSPAYAALLGAAASLSAAASPAASGRVVVACGVAAGSPAGLEARSASGEAVTVVAPALVVFGPDGPALLADRELLADRPLVESFIRREAQPLVTLYSAANEDTLFAAAAPLHLLLLASPSLAKSAASKGGGGTADSATLLRAARALRKEAVVAAVDISRHAELATFFDIAPRGRLSTPRLVALSVGNNTKFTPPDGSAAAALAWDAGAADADAGAGAVVAFVRAVGSGEVAPYVRSAAAPEPQGGAVVELVGDSHAAAVGDAERDVLVQYYSPDCGHCRKLAPVWSRVAERLSESEGGEVVVAQMDMSANDALGFEPEGFPTLIFYPRTAKQGIEYDGSRDEHDIVQFVKDVRAGKPHIGGLPDLAESEVEGAKVEL